MSSKYRPAPKRAKRYSKKGGKKNYSSTTVIPKMIMRRNPTTVGAQGSWYGSPFGRHMRTKLTYGESVAITSTSGVPFGYLFSIGGLYDPNITGTGGQPRFMDTLCGANGGVAPYNSYRVFGSKIKVTFMPAPTGSSDSLGMRGIVGIGLYDSTASAPSTIAELLARKDFKTKFLGYWYATDHTTITRTCDNATFFDIKDLRDNQETAAAYNANPALDGRWSVLWAPADEVSTRITQAYVSIEYDVEFFKRNDVSDS